MQCKKTKANFTPNYNFINEHRFFPLFCKCYNCNQIISFHKLTPKQNGDEQYNRNKIKNNILKFLSFNERTHILKNKYKLTNVRLKIYRSLSITRSKS